MPIALETPQIVATAAITSEPTAITSAVLNNTFDKSMLFRPFLILVRCFQRLSL